MALDAQDAAEAAEATAADMAAAAIAAAMTELHIDGTVKTVGESSVDAEMGQADQSAAPATDPDIVTGFQGMMREDSGRCGEGPSISHGFRASPRLRRISKPSRPDLAIGKTLDTTDDKARLTVIHSRAGSKKVSVLCRWTGRTDGLATHSDDRHGLRPAGD